MSAICKSFVKYAELDKMLDDWARNIFVGSTANIIIDLNTIIRRMFIDGLRSSGEEDIERPSSAEIAGDMLNLIGHYRAYFDRMDKRTVVYILGNINTDTPCKNALSEMYRKMHLSHLDQDWFREAVVPGIKTALFFAKYVPRVYYLECNDFSMPHAVYHLLKGVCREQDPKLVLSNDLLVYQLSSMCKILDFKYSAGVNEITPDNAYTVLLEGSKTVSEFGMNFYPEVLALAGDKQIGLQGLPRFGFPTAVKEINRAVRELRENGGAIITPKGTMLKSDKPDEIVKSLHYKAEADIIDANLRIIDIFDYSPLDYVDSHRKITSMFVTNVVTKDYVMKAARELFESNPLRLDKIFIGENTWFDKPVRGNPPPSSLSQDIDNGDDDCYDTKRTYD